MNAEFLEKCLFNEGQATMLYTNKNGYINTKTTASVYWNIYEQPTQLNCYSYNFNEFRTLYSGLNKVNSKDKDEECIWVKNNYDALPTAGAMELFAYRVYLAQRSCDINVSGQRFPILLTGTEKQKLTLQNIYNQYDGNQPVIFGEKSQMKEIDIKAVNTLTPFVADKLNDYKKEIFNEALTFLGINNMSVHKKERLTENESNENNELVNLNLQAMLVPRMNACREFNEKFNLTGTDKEISVRVRSDLQNIIKMEQSIISDYQDNGQIDDSENINKIKEVIENE